MDTQQVEASTAHQLTSKQSSSPLTKGEPGGPTSTTSEKESDPAKESGGSCHQESETSDYDEDSFEAEPPPPDPKEWHNDHWDEVIDYYNPYAECNWPGEDWFTTHIETLENSVSNETLCADPITQHWLQTLSSLQRQNLPSLEFDPDPGHPNWFGGVRREPLIPLFQDKDTGDEYQLRLHFSSGLAHIWCPAVNPQLNLPLQKEHPLLLVRYRLPQPEPKETPTGIENGEISSQPPLLLPHFLRPLGVLAVRSTGRYPDFYLGPELLTEITDYYVMLDVGSESLSVWILCSRRRLRDRAHEEQGCVTPICPIFKGQMLEKEDPENSDGYGYDAACILDSVRRLGTCDFQEACELVGQTRAIADPGRVLGLVLDSKWKEIIGDR